MGCSGSKEATENVELEEGGSRAAGTDDGGGAPLPRWGSRASAQRMSVRRHQSVEQLKALATAGESETVVRARQLLSQCTQHYVHSSDIEAAIRKLRQIVEMLQSEKSVSPASVHLSALALKLMAHAYRNRCYGDLVANQENAREHYESALVIHGDNPTDFEEWCEVTMSLAALYEDRTIGEHEENVEKAIELYERVMAERKLHGGGGGDENDAAEDEKMARDAMLANVLAECYRQRERGDRSANLEQSLELAQNALLSFDKKKYTKQWCLMHNNIAITLLERIVGDKAENVRKAITHLEASLSERHAWRDTIEYAQCARNLGLAYVNAGQIAEAKRVWTSALAQVERMDVFVFFFAAGVDVSMRHRLQLADELFALYANSVTSLVMLKAPEEALGYVARCKASRLAHAVAGRVMPSFAAADGALRTQFEALTARVREAFVAHAADEASASFDAFQGVAREWHTFVDTHDPVYGAMCTPLAVPSRADVLAAVAHEDWPRATKGGVAKVTAVFEHFSAGGRAFTFALHTDRVEVIAANAGGARLLDAVEAYQAVVNGKGSLSATVLSQQLVDISEALNVNEIYAQALEMGATQIVIGLHHALEWVPLSSLSVSTHGGQLLCDLLLDGVRAVPSCNYLVWRQRTRRRDPPATATPTPLRPATVVTANERSENVQSVLTQLRAFGDNDASAARVVATDDGGTLLRSLGKDEARLLYIACEAQANLIEAGASTLQLVSASPSAHNPHRQSMRRKAPTVPDVDARLIVHADKILGSLRLPECRLCMLPHFNMGSIVVASPHNSALFLPTALLYAGAEHVVYTSLPSLPPDLVTLFHLEMLRSLSQSWRAPPAALATAQLWMRSLTIDDTRNVCGGVLPEHADSESSLPLASPYFWASQSVLG